MQIGRHFSTTGLLVGTFFFAMSLTPTLLPRTAVVQGVISGVSLVAGYGVGVLGHWLWIYLELATPRARIQRIFLCAAAVGCTLIAAFFLWQASSWQNSVRSLMEVEEFTGMQPLLVGLIALFIFVCLLFVARLFRGVFQYLSHKFQRFIPRRVSHLLGFIAAFALFWAIIDGIVFTLVLRAMDRSYQQIDALIEPEIQRPSDSFKSGSSESLIDWEGLGRQGRRVVSSGPTIADLSGFAGTAQVQQPLRVYVGLNSADTPEERAALALQELKRVGAFERSLLLLITPTGTGWVDPGAINTIEYLQRGDIASVAVQYSYLPSPVSLLVEGDYGAETARAVFERIYGYWTEMPKDRRPQLYLHGLSLGAMNSDRSFDLYDIIDDPFKGVLWSGPPYRSDTWRTVTARRDPDSPAWLPRFRDGSVVRFANQHQGVDVPDSDWGAFRIAFLQYASDPVTFFEMRSLYREPDWMREPRGPDVSPDLRWFPIITWLQLLADMAAGSSPNGYGHNYAAHDYLDVWMNLTQPKGWSESEVHRLKRVLEQEQ